MRLVEPGMLRARKIRLEEYLSLLGKIISEWKTPVIRAPGGVVVDEDLGVYTALREFGVRYIPVVDDAGEAGGEVPLDLLDPFHEVRGGGARVYDSVVDLVSRDLPTPLVKLKSLSRGDVRVWAKLEWYHPFSLSIKDRVAWYMLHRLLEEEGNPRKLYEASSTNTGMALVGLGNYHGVKVRVYLPSTAQRCVDYVFQAMGAEARRESTPITIGMLNKVLIEASRDGAIVLNQFENDYNFLVHLRYTAKEADYQLMSMGVRPSAVVAGLGTSGHFSALSFYFKHRYGRVKTIGVQPAQGSSIPGLRRIETGVKWLHSVEADEVVDVTLEEALKGVLHVARGDGIMPGFSSGAVAYALMKLVENGSLSGDVIVVFPDHGLKYVELLEGLLAEKCVEEAPQSWHQPYA
ncbi:cysteine synthase [Desulfurococcus mucosus DSM 2162]|uniref:Cysteine synthase n=1 Tax=Desulfurococcus mucosus (strain ATCC 35584 / DSM 2162 / JCM 9187 / O7/1) TaxID=765177 RepID=E8R8X6_DESM0|nr:cysteine synthase [Desulfurococcus mucosus DSM 2162]